MDSPATLSTRHSTNPKSDILSLLFILDEMRLGYFRRRKERIKLAIPRPRPNPLKNFPKHSGNSNMAASKFLSIKKSHNESGYETRRHGDEKECNGMPFAFQPFI